MNAGLLPSAPRLESGRPIRVLDAWMQALPRYSTRDSDANDIRSRRYGNSRTVASLIFRTYLSALRRKGPLVSQNHSPPSRRRTAAV